MKFIFISSAITFFICGLAMSQGKKPPQSSKPAPVSVKEEVVISSAQPMSPGEFKVISLEEAKKFFDEKSAVFIDARSYYSYNMRHIKGALNCPYEVSDNRIFEIKNQFPPETIFIVYCVDENCGLAKRVGMRMLQHGFKHVLLFAEGWEKWILSNCPAEP